MQLVRGFAFPLASALLLVQSSDSQHSHNVPFHPPPGVLVAGLRETATHRSSIPSLRIASDHGGPANLSFWLHLDAAGRVLDVKGIETEDFMSPSYDPSELIEAMRKVTYAPFTRSGSPVEAWAQDTVELLPREDSNLLSLLKTVSPFPDLNPTTNFSMSLSRSGCFGWCPAYAVTIRGDGTVSYKGSWYVSIDGQHTAHISPEAARQLLERFRKANFFSLKSEYRAGVTDNPTYCLELVVGARKKIITDYVGEWVGMPASVPELEEAVDQVADSARWVTASPQTLKAMNDAGISPASDEANKILDRAVTYGRVDAVRDLLAAGVPITGKNESKDFLGMRTSSGSLLEDAGFYSGDSELKKEVISALLESPAIRGNKPALQRALGKAAAEGQVEIARMLIARGADPQALFQDTSNADDKIADQTFLMRAVESGVWSIIDDALSRPHNINAIDRDGRSALAMVIWTSPPAEDIFPIIDKLIADGAGKKELDRALADACDRPEWRDGLVARGGDPKICAVQKN